MNQCYGMGQTKYDKTEILHKKRLIKVFFSSIPIMFFMAEASVFWFNNYFLFASFCISISTSYTNTQFYLINQNKSCQVHFWLFMWILFEVWLKMFAWACTVVRTIGGGIGMMMVSFTFGLIGELLLRHPTDKKSQGSCPGFVIGRALLRGMATAFYFRTEDILEGDIDNWDFNK